MTKQDRINDDIAQLEYIRQWKTRKAVKKSNRDYYKATLIHHLKMTWFSFKKCVKG